MENKKYRVVASTFKGRDERGNHTYEIVFNQSLEHTGRFTGIEDGLNMYVKKEEIGEVKYALLVILNYINPFKKS